MWVQSAQNYVGTALARTIQAHVNSDESGNSTEPLSHQLIRGLGPIAAGPNIIEDHTNSAGIGKLRKSSFVSRHDSEPHDHGTGATGWHRPVTGALGLTAHGGHPARCTDTKWKY